MDGYFTERSLTDVSESQSRFPTLPMMREEETQPIHVRVYRVLGTIAEFFRCQTQNTDVRGLQVVWIRVYMFHSITRFTHNCPIDILRGRRLLDAAGTQNKSGCLARAGIARAS
jgi:hypothetical protein